MSNIEEDIKFIEEMIKEYKTFGDLHNPDYEDTDRIYKALENVLERIKELEEALLKVKDKNIKLFINSKNSIPKQKVKEILDRLHITDIEPWSFYKVSGEILFDLKELLEDK